MRLAVLYDIHGNLPALEAVLTTARSESIDRIVIGGDIFPGPMAREVFHHLSTIDLPVDYIRGNGDRALIDVTAGRESRGLPPALVPLFEWHSAQLAPVDVERVAQWPLTVTRSIPELGDVLFCHATPRDDNEMFSMSTPAEQIAPAFSDIDAKLVICGHTHRQFDRMIGNIRVVNAGSTGMPFGGTDAEWLMLSDSVELRRTPYDLTDAIRRIRATDYPRKEEFIQIALTPRAAREGR